MTSSQHTIQIVPMSHYCAGATSADRIAHWDAEVSISASGYMTETVQCPACGSWVAVEVPGEDDE